MTPPDAFYRFRPPLFTIAISFLSLVAIGETYLTWCTAQQISRVEKHLRQQSKKLEMFTQTVPAPTSENLDAALRNVATLEKQLYQNRASLYHQTDPRDRDTIKPLRASHQILFKIQESIDTLRIAASSHRPPIHLPENFHFGFDSYIRSGTPPNPHNLSLLSQHHHLITTLVTKLYTAAPHSLLSVKLIPYSNSTPDTVSEPDTTPHRSKKYQAINSTAPLIFELTFTGYTHTLRSFLNQITSHKEASGRLLSTRQIAVTPAKPLSQPPKGQSAEELEALFNSLSDETYEGSDQPSATELIIAEKLSQFRITVECLDVREGTTGTNPTQPL